MGRCGQTGLDLLEDSVFERGLKEGGEDARFILKHRRYNNKSPEVRSNFLLDITDEEHQARLERLGLVFPYARTEGDYDEEDAPAGKTDSLSPLEEYAKRDLLEAREVLAIPHPDEPALRFAREVVSAVARAKAANVLG